MTLSHLFLGFQNLKLMNHWHFFWPQIQFEKEPRNMFSRYCKKMQTLAGIGWFQNHLQNSRITLQIIISPFPTYHWARIICKGNEWVAGSYLSQTISPCLMDLTRGLWSLSCTSKQYCVPAEEHFLGCAIHCANVVIIFTWLWTLFV